MEITHSAGPKMGRRFPHCHTLLRAVVLLMASGEQSGQAPLFPTWPGSRGGQPLSSPSLGQADGKAWEGLRGCYTAEGFPRQQATFGVFQGLWALFRDTPAPTPGLFKLSHLPGRFLKSAFLDLQPAATISVSFLL